ncbi:DUF3060 domain-containing protein [Streptomyces cyaneochromogenes]|uniref:DUF3060 domain-containing protein n=1 Tax=Streptomyces cyaneochromogenes TaxID=2496836 RepID=UPI001589B13C|nr:DUF3060 domain-containing protein [Streptomyces cyaneochromogenes]
MEVDADEVRLTLTGTCGEVSVYGEGNGVYVEHTDELSVGGNLNPVYCVDEAKVVYRETGPPGSQYTTFHTIINCYP